jgi:hypothetical protein
MKREEQELLERAEGNESREEEPEIEVDQQADGLEDEFDREFWIKVLNFYVLRQVKNLNSEFGLFAIEMGYIIIKLCNKTQT